MLMRCTWWCERGFLLVARAPRDLCASCLLQQTIVRVERGYFMWQWRKTYARHEMAMRGVSVWCRLLALKTVPVVRRS